MLGFLAIAGAGIWVTGFAPSVDAAIAQRSNPSVNASQTIQLTQVTELTSPALTSEAIETQLTPQADGTITGEVTFTGNANELAVIHIPRSATLLSYGYNLTLYNAAGESVRVGYNYPEFEPFWNSDGGTYRVILLPETGTYRLTYEGQIRDSDGGDITADSFDYRVQVRTATYYERLLIAAEDSFDNDQPDKAFDLWALAIADSPDRSAAYMHRLFAILDQLSANPEIVEKIEAALPTDYNDLEKIEETLFPTIHEIFLSLAEEEKALILGDLRQLNQLMLEAIADGDFDPTENGVSPTWFSGIANFLETGEPSDELIQIFFGTAQVSAEPVIVPSE
ncbi:MAG: hypothetical protein AAFU53_16750 [Cyanobacteria bacterium J06632_3]